MSRVPAELAGALEILKSNPIFGDEKFIEAKKTRARYKEVECGSCNGTGRNDWWIEGKGRARAGEGPCFNCEATKKVWVPVK